MRDYRKIIQAVDKPIVFVGLMGAGKTTIGRRVARRLGLSFKDLDKEIEKASGSSIVDLFLLYGEEWFRKGETGVLNRVLHKAPLIKVLSTGEGAFLTPENRELIKQEAISIWLKADLDLLVKRTSHRDTRPQLLNVDARDVLDKLIEKRYPIYQQADIVVETKDEPLSNTADKVLELLERKYVFGD
ncbi:MAG: shikimate kinase [Alphaproteobacteria bacterium]|nr:shikimate kinase [Alphaproteobacteria bacterium]MBN2779827.1 shikimate kinase [Alphaproteobacteria bacterium]